TDFGPTFTYIKSVFVNTLAGDGNAGFVNGTGASAQFNGASRMAINSSGEIVLADFNNHSIRLINTKNEVSTIAGDGTSGLVNGVASNARFARPFGVAIDNSGNIFIADFDNHVIRKISTSNIVSTYAGTGQAGFANGSAGVAAFNGPIDVAVDASGNVYVADLNNHAIRKIDINGNVTTLAGNGTAGLVDGKGSTARFNNPIGLGVDNSNNIYVADLANHAIRKVDSGGNVTTIAGDGTTGSTDGSIASARFNFPYDVDLDASGNLYIADDKNHKIRIIKTNNTVETFAGSGTEGFLDGLGSDAQFNDPVGITVVNSELMYVGDSENHRVRIITLE
ncbi:MAG: gluconolactonase, partial [Cyclobacteriaceae bacterium]|nr:gluconolactonase [Cyclobacteriaceae bacterium]